MKEATLELLEGLKSEQLKAKFQVLNAEMSRGDEADQINYEREQALHERLNGRKVLFLKKVESAKKKILEGSYGICEDCGADISKERLMARPTAHLCIDCQENKERGEFQQITHRRDLKLISN